MRTLVLMILAPLLPVTTGCAAGADEAPPAEERALVSETAVPVYLNHTLGMFTQTTIDSLQRNTYLRNSFIDVEVRTTERPDITYTGTYLNGRQTYVEFFSEGTVGIPLNVFQLALGTELAGSSEVVQQKWNDEFDENQTEIPLFYRRVNGMDVPWFRGVIPAWTSTTQSLALFSGEYVPNPGSSVPRTRLEERAARYQPGKLARDVQAFVYAAPPGEIDLFRRALTSVGWSAATRDDGFLALSPLDGGTRRAVLAIQSPPADAGLLGVLFRLNRFEQHTEPLDGAVLRVGILGQPYAVLWFADPSPELESALVTAMAP